MTVPTRGPRSDLPYLRRRIRPASAVPAASLSPSVPTPAPSSGSDAPRPTAPGLSLAPPAGTTARPPTPAPSSTGLTLGPSSAPSPSSAPRGGAVAGTAPSRPGPPRKPQPFAAPALGDIRELDERNPVLRVDRRRSAVGTLLITGASSIAWESETFLTGAATAEGETSGAIAATSGNRPLLEFDEGRVLVALRHIRELRRALVLGRRTDALGLRFFGGETLTLPTGVPGELTILQLLVVDGLLELRAEPVDPRWSDADVHQEFSFSLTHRFALPDDGG